MLNQDVLLGFLLGIIITLLGAIFSNFLTKKRERQAICNEKHFTIYMKLMELYGYYFWISSAELQNKKPENKILAKCRDIAWEIADILRYVDEFEFLEDILKITHGSEYNKAFDRYTAMGDLLERLGTKINPKYSKIIKKITSDNINNPDKYLSSNAPAKF